MSDPFDITVTLTEEECAFRQAARDAGIPSLMVSMYAGALRKLVDAEREACAKLADEWPRGHDDVYLLADAIRARGQK